MNRLDVSDADAIRLGQYTQKDIESGGFERIEPGTTLTKMVDKVQSFTNILFQGSADQDMSISELISANGHEALRWLLDHGCISDNQYTSALNAKGDLTADAKLDIRNIMAANLFKGASPVLKEKFGELPAAAQKALLETVYRDMHSESDRKIMPEIHKSIEAFSELMKMPAFKDARNVEMAVKALQDYVRQFAFDEVTGETVSPSDKFSNFALHLAALYKGSTQRDLRALFNRFYDNVQGKVEASLFEEADTEMKTVADAVKTVFGIDYKPLKAKEDGNGSNGTGTLGVDNNGGPSRERGGGNDAEGGKLVSQGNGDADNTGGNGSNSGQGKGTDVTDSGRKLGGGKPAGGGEVKEQRVSSGDGKKVANSAEEQALVEGLVGVMRKASIVVHTDVEAGQKRLDSADGANVRMQAKLDSLLKACNTIKKWLQFGKKGKSFTISLPESTLKMIRRAMGRDFDSHNITSDGIAHANKNHGANGRKLTANSIPIRKEDFSLIPYIVTAPDRVEKGSFDIRGRESIRFYKELSNGYVVVVEKEYIKSPNDMETINMWAEKSDKATNARSKTAPDTNVQNAILDIDAAKIRKDAEDAIRNDEKIRQHKVYVRS